MTKFKNDDKLLANGIKNTKDTNKKETKAKNSHMKKTKMKEKLSSSMNSQAPNPFEEKLQGPDFQMYHTTPGTHYMPSVCWMKRQQNLGDYFTCKRIYLHYCK